jgi:hypothetical protein
MSKNSSHAQKMNTKFEKEEKARRERAGKMTEASAKQPTEQPPPRFNFSDDRRA